MRLDLNYHLMEKKSRIPGKKSRVPGQKLKNCPIFELFGPKRGPGVNLTEKIFSSKDAPGSKLSFDGKKSRVPGKKSRVPGQKPHFLTYLVQNGVRGSIWPKKFFRQKMRLGLNYHLMEQKSRVPGKKSRVPGQKPVFKYIKEHINIPFIY